jgi:hypothetical protein
MDGGTRRVSRPALERVSGLTCCFAEQGCAFGGTAAPRKLNRTCAGSTTGMRGTAAGRRRIGRHRRPLTESGSKLSRLGRPALLRQPGNCPLDRPPLGQPASAAQFNGVDCARGLGLSCRGHPADACSGAVGAVDRSSTQGQQGRRQFGSESDGIARSSDCHYSSGGDTVDPSQRASPRGNQRDQKSDKVC